MKLSGPLGLCLLTRCVDMTYSVLYCSSAVLDPRVGHNMDVISAFISVLCYSEFLIDSSTYDVVHAGRACVVFLACVHLALFLALSLSPGNSLFHHGVTVLYEGKDMILFVILLH